MASQLQGLEAPALPLSQVAADAGPVLLVMGDHGGDVVQGAVPRQLFGGMLGQGGFAVLAPAGKKDRHTLKLSPARISSR